MAERAPTPVPEKMIRGLPTPDHSLGFYTEMVSLESSRYQALTPIKRGSLYSEGKGTDQRVIDAFPALYFCKQLNPFGSTIINSMPQDLYCVWIWSTSPDSESQFNSAVEYLGDAVANPSYTRVLNIRRDVYDATPALVLGSTLTALTGVAVTAGGSGYTFATGAVGNATVEFVVAGGAIISGIVTNEGSGISSGAAITITGDGTGATATARVQPVAAVLTRQVKKELPESDPLSNEFIQVIRTYEVLPGPDLPMTRYDELLGPVQVLRRAVVWASQPASLTATGKVTYEAREGSSYVAWRLTESWSDGTGNAGNPAYPTAFKDGYDDTRGAVQITTQLVVATGSEAGTLTESGGVITRTSYEPFNQFLLRKIIETWAAAGPTLTTRSLGQDNLIPAKYRSLVVNAETNQLVDKDYTFPAGLTGDEAQIVLAQLNIQQARLKILSEIINAESSLTGHELGEYGTITIVESIVNDGTAIDTGYLVLKSSVDPLGNGKSIKITASVASYPTRNGQTYNPKTDSIEQFTTDIVAAGSAPIGTNRKDVRQIDSRRSEVKTLDIAAIQAALGAVHFKYEFKDSVPLPRELIALTAVWEFSESDGTSSESGTGASAAVSGTSISLNASNSSQGSASVLPEIIPEFRPVKPRLSGVDHYFFLPFVSGAITESAVLAKIGGGAASWPNFNPVEHTLVLRGQKVSVGAHAMQRFSSSASTTGVSTAQSTGKGYSKDFGSSVRAITLPPCVHGLITLEGGGTLTKTSSAHADVALGFTTAASQDKTLDAVGYVGADGSPGTLVSYGPTSGAATIPSGVFLWEYPSDNYGYGMAAVRARVFNLP